MVTNKRDIYNVEKSLNTLLKKLNNLNRYDAQTLKEFYEYLRITKNLEPQTLYQRITYLYNISLYFNIRLKSINEHNVKQIKRIIDEFTSNSLQSRKKYYIALKHLLRFLRKDHLINYFTYSVKDNINVSLYDFDIILKLIDVLPQQHKILTMLLWETGARVKEVFNIKRKDILVKDEVLLINILDIKKNTPRLVFIKEFKEEIEEHIKNIPYDEYIINTTYTAYRKALKIASKKLNLYQPITPKILRKARATFLAQYLNETQLRAWFGWSFSSDIPKHYINLAIIMNNKELLERIPSLKERYVFNPRSHPQNPTY